MQLFSRTIGAGQPVLILHGLLGMSDNWMSIARKLAPKGFAIHLLDLRNHGKSPHTDSHRYPDMCDDLTAYITENNLNSIKIIGHSMGGKLAMIFSLLNPEIVNQLVIVDMAPADYRSPDNTFHTNLLTTLIETDLNRYSSRSEIRKELDAQLGDKQLAMFLTKNIGKDESENRFIWKCNLPVLRRYMQHLHIGLEELEIYAPCPVETLFIKGNLSNYYRQEHDRDRMHYFPHSHVVGIDNAGHWVHSEQPIQLTQCISQFLSR